VLAAIGVVALVCVVGESQLLEVLDKKVVGGVVVGQVVNARPADVELLELGTVER
jgi:hypothetical protein